MARRKNTILVGAGAECATPFKLPSGKDFVLDTCYHSNDKLYKALEEFYRGRLSDAKGKSDSRAPHKYQPQFLYSAKNVEFKKLADYIVANSHDTELYAQLKEYLLKNDASEVSDNLNEDGLDVLFNMLIKRDAEPKAITKLHSIALAGIPDDAYYGIIESYFAALINPKRRSQSFWRLINYYWSAYFSVAGPLIDRTYKDDRLYKQKGLYTFTLSNLREVVETIAVGDLYTLEDIGDTYYDRFQGMFDNVLTTNYTGLSEALFPGDSTEKKCVYLSGALWQFERLDSLATFDLLSQSACDQLRDNDFIFPFLMTQAPAKPLIDARQIKAYARALDVLNGTDLLVVLGYSFCESDYHISALVRDYMLRPGSRLVYLDHGGKMTKSELKRLLRLDKSTDFDIKLLSTDDKGLNELQAILEIE